MAWKRCVACGILCFAGSCATLWAQNHSEDAGTRPRIVLTLKRSIDLALQNSKDIQLAKIQSRVADNSANLTKAEFLPNLYAGSGAGYTYGLPETPGGSPPSIFSLTYTEEVFNGPLRGLAREQQEQAKAQRFLLEDTRNNVMDQVATSYLELVKVRHSLELLRKEKDSAEKIVDVTQERQGEGFELPTEVTKAQLTKAQVVQRILQLEGRQDELEVYLRDQLGLGAGPGLRSDTGRFARFRGTRRSKPDCARFAGKHQPGVRGIRRESRRNSGWKGREKGYWPTLQLVAIYDIWQSIISGTIRRFITILCINNLNAGINVNVPIFSAKTRANVALAQASLDAAKINLANKRTQVSAEVRQRSKKVQEMEAAKEVARLELQLAQQNLASVAVAIW